MRKNEGVEKMKKENAENWEKEREGEQTPKKKRETKVSKGEKVLT